MSNQEMILLYVLVGGRLMRYLLETDINDTLSETEEEWKGKVNNLFYQRMPSLKGKCQILDYEVSEITVLRGTNV